MNRALSAGRLVKGALPPREQLNRYLLLNIYGLPLSALWGGLNTIIAPYAIERLVSADHKNTYLGLLLFFGLGVAVITQPFAGSVSDRYGSRAGRRRPFILGSAILDGVFIIAFGLATNFWLAFVAYALLQVVSNFGQAAYQALIPDFAPRQERGVASGAKQALEVFGSVVGLGVAGFFTSIDVPWGATSASSSCFSSAPLPPTATCASRRPRGSPSSRGSPAPA